MKKRSENQLRQAWFRRPRKEDVNQMLEELEQRNRELGSELENATERGDALFERVTAAEDTLETFHATLEQMGTLLSLAQERARQIEAEAEAHAARLRSPAEERERQAALEVEALMELKREALASIANLRSSLGDVAEPSAPRPEPQAEPAVAVVHPLPVESQPAPVEALTVADLLALEANARS